MNQNDVTNNALKRLNAMLNQSSVAFSSLAYVMGVIALKTIEMGEALNNIKKGEK